MSFGILIPVAMIWPLPAHPQSEDTHTPFRVTELKGTAVENPEGDRLGTVENLVVDLQTRQVVYVVISAGGLFGVLADLRPVPPEVLTVERPDPETPLVIDISEDRWSEAPSLELPENIARLGQESYGEQIYGFYGQSWQTRQRAPAFGSDEATPDRENESLEELGRLRLAQDITGLTITTRTGEEVGQLEDMLIHLDRAWIPFVLISPATDFWETTDELYAVAPHALVLISDRALLKIQPGDLEEARLLTVKNLHTEALKQAKISAVQAREQPDVFRYAAEPEAPTYGGRDDPEEPLKIPLQ